MFNPVMTFLTQPKLWDRYPADLKQSEADFLHLRAEADRYLALRGPAVTEKVKAGPSGDLHDYVSQAPYWWPDPFQPDGLPYIKRDGELNPEQKLTDRGRLEHLREGISCLILRAQLPDGQSHAAQAGEYLRRWFLDADTRMNPNLQFGQFIPGVCEGRGIGIIDTHMFCYLLDEVSHLPEGEHWTARDASGLRTWFENYLEWLLTSDHGRTELREHNNHGTWYDAQVVCFALFCGRPEIARRQLAEWTRPRFGNQIQADGRQPHELARTLSQSYCTFNLIAFSFLAEVSKQVGMNLWAEEPGLLAGIRWMLPYYQGVRSWENTQIKPFNRLAMGYLLNFAAQSSGAEDFQKAAEALHLPAWNKISGWGIDVNPKAPAGTAGR